MSQEGNMFQDLIDRKLVKGNSLGDLTIFKYARKVFYNNLWNTDSRLLDARGMVLDSKGNKVIWPFTKVFNYGENGTTVSRDQRVKWVRKVNGFMASARWYNGELLVSTTGSLTSDFVKLAKSVLDQYRNTDAFWQACSAYTLIFEICDESDPHIVDEQNGAYLIGVRNMSNGVMMSEDFCDWVASHGGFLRPKHGVAQFDLVVNWSKNVEHEGFMVRSLENGEILLKLKSNHYLTKKFLMRASEKRMAMLWSDKQEFVKTLDDEFYGICDNILEKFETVADWCDLPDQQRRKFVEGVFNAS